MGAGAESCPKAFNPASSFGQEGVEMPVAGALLFEGFEPLPMEGEFGGEILAALGRLQQARVGNPAFLLGGLQSVGRRQQLRIEGPRLMEDRCGSVALAAGTVELGAGLRGDARGVGGSDPGLVLTLERDCMVPDAFVPLAQRFPLGAVEGLRRLEHFR